MSCIFGVVALGDHPDLHPMQGTFERLDASLQAWGPLHFGHWHDERCALGSRWHLNTPEASGETGPRTSTDAGFTLVAEARLDNRPVLFESLGLVDKALPDSAVIEHAWRRWGEACADRLIGDWSFAVWTPASRTLFIARDHTGNTALHYWQDGQRLIFASSPKALLDAGAPGEIDDFYVAQVLISWPGYHGPQTVHKSIRRLPPAHTLRFNPDGLHTRRYWVLEDVPDLPRLTFDDYCEEFLALYQRAVDDRLRSHGAIAATLSGGLDSGSVVSLAARTLHKKHKQLMTYTSIPAHDTSDTHGQRRFGNEWAMASLTASRYPNIVHKPLACEHASPIAAIERRLQFCPEPQHAASNMFWMSDLLATSAADGATTLLTGQGGNATVSWTGAMAPPPLWQQLVKRQYRAAIRQLAPPVIRRAVIRSRMLSGDRVWQGTALSPSLAKRSGLTPAYLKHQLAVNHSRLPPREQRYEIIKPGAMRVGDLWAISGAVAGIEVRDPTFDKRVMEYVIGIPDGMFRSADRVDRWLIRHAMQGIMPDDVRLNQKRGYQASDLVHRLRAHARDVERALISLENGPAPDYVDLGKMRSVWSDVQRTVSPMLTHHAGSILLRGLMAGMFVNQASHSS